MYEKSHKISQVSKLRDKSSNISLLNLSFLFKLYVPVQGEAVGDNKISTLISFLLKPELILGRPYLFPLFSYPFDLQLSISGPLLQLLLNSLKRIDLIGQVLRSILILPVSPLLKYLFPTLQNLTLYSRIKRL